MTPSVRIKKTITPIIIYTATHRIEGFYYSFESSERLLDDLNGRNTEFIPVTEARITTLGTHDGLIVAKFVAVNVHSIALFFPNPKGVGAEKESRLVASDIVPDLIIGT